MAKQFFFYLIRILQIIYFSTFFWNVFSYPFIILLFSSRRWRLALPNTYVYVNSYSVALAFVGFT